MQCDFTQLKPKQQVGALLATDLIWTVGLAGPQFIIIFKDWRLAQDYNLENRRNTK